jgi:hypothetical protein
MGSSKSASISQEPIVTPAVAKDAQMAQNMIGQQSQARALRRGIGATYTRFNQIQDNSTTGAKTTLG